MSPEFWGNRLSQVFRRHSWSNSCVTLACRSNALPSSEWLSKLIRTTIVKAFRLGFGTYYKLKPEKFSATTRTSKDLISCHWVLASSMLMWLSLAHFIPSISRLPLKKSLSTFGIFGAQHVIGYRNHSLQPNRWG